jgi:hypothetical protein
VQAVKKEMRSFTTGLSAGDAEEAAKPTRVFAQGMPSEPREEVVPGFLSALDPNPPRLPRGKSPPGAGVRWPTGLSRPRTR